MSENQQVGWIVEVQIKNGKVDDFKALAAEMVRQTEENEAGTLLYEWNISDDNTGAMSIERYIDSDAAMVHINNFVENFAERFSAALEQTRLLVYGNPNEKVRKALSDAGGIFTIPVAGFLR